MVYNTHDELVSRDKYILSVLKASVHRCETHHCGYKMHSYNQTGLHAFVHLKYDEEGDEIWLKAQGKSRKKTYIFKFKPLFSFYCFQDQP